MSYDYRYHCLADGDDSALACGRVNLEDCTNVGSVLPDKACLCKHYARARPDVVEEFERSARGP